MEVDHVAACVTAQSGVVDLFCADHVANRGRCGVSAHMVMVMGRMCTQSPPADGDEQPLQHAAIPQFAALSRTAAAAARQRFMILGRLGNM
eukprot:gene14178-5239_t